MKLELSESLEEQLRERAKHLGVNVEDLARAAVADLVGQPAPDFEKAAQEVLARNADLYRRLA